VPTTAADIGASSTIRRFLGFQGNIMTATGHCLCGEVVFECDDLGPASYCHCEDCRRLTGSAFNVGVRCSSDGFRIISGSLGHFTKRGSSGFELTRWFCRMCGSPIYGSSPVDPSIVYVRAGAIDDPALVKPELQAWVVSKVVWADIPHEIQSLQKSRRGAR
jgi:hypothetical protein